MVNYSQIGGFTTVTQTETEPEEFKHLPHSKGFLTKKKYPAYKSGWEDVVKVAFSPINHYLCNTALRIGRDLRLNRLFIYCPICMVVREYVKY